jgi:hypothetical protein
MGKSVVIHKSDNTRWVCATIGYPFDVKTVKATFDDGLIQGTITMKQDKSNHSAETTVLVDVKYVDASMSSTSFHNYHVHTDPINYEASSFCDSTGGHWNPYNISTLYCGTDPSKWTGCEVSLNAFFGVLKNSALFGMFRLEILLASTARSILAALPARFSTLIRIFRSVERTVLPDGAL